MQIPNTFILFINIFIILIYAAMIYSGYKKGFLYELISVLYNLIALVISWLLCPVLAAEFPIVSMEKLSGELAILSHFVDIGPLVNSLIYFVLIFIVLRVLYLIVGLIAKSLNKLPVVGTLNAICGAAVGLVNATIIVTVLSLLLALPVFTNGKEIRSKTLFTYIETYSDKALDFVTDNMDLSGFKQKYEDFDVEAFRANIKEWIDDQREKQ